MEVTRPAEVDVAADVDLVFVKSFWKNVWENVSRRKEHYGRHTGAFMQFPGEPGAAGVAGSAV